MQFDQPYLKSATRCSGKRGARNGGACALVMLMSLCCACATGDLRRQRAVPAVPSICNFQMTECGCAATPVRHQLGVRSGSCHALLFEQKASYQTARP
jgi:hypothetical protein